MKKQWSGFWAIMAAAFVLTTLSWTYCLIGAAVTVGYVIFAVWWWLYFRRIRYCMRNGEINIESGVVFRKTRSIPISSVLWTNRITLRLPRVRETIMATILHTGGGSTVLFANVET